MSEKVSISCCLWHTNNTTPPAIIKKITYCCSLRTRRTWHPRLPRSTLYKREMLKKKLLHQVIFIFFYFMWHAHAYFDSRYSRCAVFPINTWQTLRKQAEVIVIWHSQQTNGDKQTKCFHSHLLPFYQLHLEDPECLGCPAKKKKIPSTSVYVHKRIIFPIQVL